MARGVVLGGTSGVGLAVTDLLVGAGDEVTVMSRRLPAASCGPDRRHVSVDVRHYDPVAKALRALRADGRIDFVVNCVGIGFFAPAAAGYAPLWNEILSANVAGLLNVLASIDAECADLGLLLHVSSLAAHRPSLTPGNSCYSASKLAAAAILGDYRRALQMARRDTRVCVISPGVIENTGFVRDFYSRKREDGNSQRLEVGPALTPIEVANLILYIIRLPDHIEILDLLVNLKGRH